LILAALPGLTAQLGQAGLASLLLILVAAVSIWLIQDWLGLRARLWRSNRRLAEARQQVEAVFRLSSRFAQADDGNEVVELVLRACIEVAGALGASFVPFDEQGHPLQPTSLGRLPEPRLEGWTHELDAVQVKQACQACLTYHADGGSHACPIHPGPFSGGQGLACLPVSWRKRKLGIVILYREEQEDLADGTRRFLTAMLDEMALALEAIRLRDRELTTLRKMQAFKQNDLAQMLSLALDSAARLAEADFAHLSPQDRQFPLRLAALNSSTVPDDIDAALPAFARQVRDNGAAFVLGGAKGIAELHSGWQGLAGCPVRDVEGRIIAVLTVGSRSRSFTPSQVALLETVSTQIALLAGYSRLVEDLEFQAMMAERRRLAREIHDGLAQTLGFLKLMSTQQQAYLENGQLDRLRQNLELTHATLRDAYEDVRQSIDGLRMSPENGLGEWIRQTVADFEALSGLSVEVVDLEINQQLETEVQAQLARILQECLTNIRKHAQASRVWLRCHVQGSDLVLEVRDDGHGFEPEDIMGLSQHGIKGMRERAELIGADFQIRSCPEAGTVVAVHIPQPVEGVAP
jgi:two-component system nitrate/nitrite sensor histidine kinase NarX